VVVEYRELPQKVMMEYGKFVEGAIISFRKEKCQHIGCDSFHRCGGTELHEGTRLKILKLERSSDCAAGHRMVEIDGEIVE